MKKQLVTAVLAMCALVQCNDDTLAPPQITIDLSPVWVGERSIAEEAPPRIFNLIIQNEGEQTLTIESAALRGDQNCAFTLEGPDQTDLGDNDSAFIRIAYKPTVRGDDNVKLVIESNSTEFPTFVVPICGRGLLPEEIKTSADTDGEADTDGADSELPTDQVCSAPPDDQPDCEASDTSEE